MQTGTTTPTIHFDVKTGILGYKSQTAAPGWVHVFDTSGAGQNEWAPTYSDPNGIYANCSWYQYNSPTNALAVTGPGGGGSNGGAYIPYNTFNWFGTLTFK